MTNVRKWRIIRRRKALVSGTSNPNLARWRNRLLHAAAAAAVKRKWEIISRHLTILHIMNRISSARVSLNLGIFVQYNSYQKLTRNTWDNQWIFFYVHLPLNFISFDIAQDLMKWSPVRKKRWHKNRRNGVREEVCVCYKDAIYQHFDAATTTTASRQKKSKRIKIDVALFSILNEKMMPQLFGCNIL